MILSAIPIDSFNDKLITLDELSLLICLKFIIAFSIFVDKY